MSEAFSLLPAGSVLRVDYQGEKAVRAIYVGELTGFGEGSFTLKTTAAVRKFLARAGWLLAVEMVRLGTGKK